jgi:hypothetical protein
MKPFLAIILTLALADIRARLAVIRSHQKK